jgi:hypothetical protein
MYQGKPEAFRRGGIAKPGANPYRRDTQRNFPDEK